MKQKVIASALVGIASLVPCASALAHISIPDVGTAGKSQILTFQVGHGCEGSDTVSVEITIPPEVATAKPVPGFFGYAVVERDNTDRVSKITYTKTDAAAVDENVYELRVRVAVPDAPFTTVYFHTLQTCRSADNVVTTAEWGVTPTTPDAGEEAPHLNVLPVLAKGWNKVTVPADVTDLSFFANAEIVWSGDSAYSANPTIADLIASEDGVTVLESIDAGSEIWVKY